MTTEQQLKFDELKSKCDKFKHSNGKPKYQLYYYPKSDWGDEYWEFADVDENGVEGFRENSFSIKSFENDVLFQIS
jgi:hypothetical protein